MHNVFISYHHANDQWYGAAPTGSEYAHERHGHDFAVEYDRLCAMAEELADIRAALSVQTRMDAGAEELVPAAIADRLIDGESPLKVWRETQGMSQSSLARSASVERVQIVDIEAGRANGSVRTLAALAVALDVTLDDLVAPRSLQEGPSNVGGGLK